MLRSLKVPPALPGPFRVAHCVLSPSTEELQAGVAQRHRRVGVGGMYGTTELPDAPTTPQSPDPFREKRFKILSL